jgi:hypothetical protein
MLELWFDTLIGLNDHVSAYTFKLYAKIELTTFSRMARWFGVDRRDT